MNAKVKRTLNLLRLYRKHCCAIIDGTPSNIGMLRRVKDFITWGEISKETLKHLLEKRGRLPGNVLLTEKYVEEKLKMKLDKFAEELFTDKKSFKDLPGLKQFFRLNPPRKGFGVKGVKLPFSMGGALGYRKDTINDLIERML